MFLITFEKGALAEELEHDVFVKKKWYLMPVPNKRIICLS